MSSRIEGKPHGFPLGGRFGVPAVVPTSRVRERLVQAEVRLNDKIMQFPTSRLLPTEEAGVDPALLLALKTVASDHATLWPVESEETSTARVFEEVLSLGYWGGVAAMAERVPKYSGDGEGSASECASALFDRSGCYSIHDLLGPLAYRTSTLDDWLVHSARETALDKVLSILDGKDAQGLLTGAMVVGFGLAVAEFEIFGDSTDDDDPFDLLASEAYHHHRFNYTDPNPTLSKSPLPEDDFYWAIYQCTLASGCRHYRPWPQPDRHDHEFDLDQQVKFTLNGRPLYGCSVRGCGALTHYNGPEIEYR